MTQCSKTDRNILVIQLVHRKHIAICGFVAYGYTLNVVAYLDSVVSHHTLRSEIAMSVRRLIELGVFKHEWEDHQMKVGRGQALFLSVSTHRHIYIYTYICLCFFHFFLRLSQLTWPNRADPMPVEAIKTDQQLVDSAGVKSFIWSRPEA